MTGRKAKKAKAKRRRQHAGTRNASTLADHVRDKGKRQLVPPLLAAMQNKQKIFPWDRDMVPEMLWLASLLVEEWPDRGEHHRALNMLDPLVPEGPGCLDATLSAFSLVPEDSRAAARESLVAAKALTDDFANALTLYDDCPAAWLVEDWANGNSPDKAAGTEYFRKLVARMRDNRSPYTAQLRWVVLARTAKNGKLFMPADVIDEFQRYPRDLDDQGRSRCEALIRASLLSAAGIPGHPRETTGWAKTFWQQNRTLSACEDGAAPRNDEDTDEPSELVSSEERPLTTSDVRTAFVDAVEGLERDLQDLQNKLDLDLYEPVRDEVEMGLASRQVRLLRRFVEQPSGWTTERSPHTIRPMVDTRILAGWLVSEDDPELFERYKEFGQGKLKLLKLNFEEHISKRDAADPSHQEYVSWLEARVNEDVMEEFQTISLAPSFADRSIFRMAEDVGLKDLYNLVYSPLSGESHGDWASLRLHDLQRCTNPLHRSHRLGRFADRDETIAIDFVYTAVSLMSETVDLLFASYSVDTTQVLDRFHHAFFAALTS